MRTSWKGVSADILLSESGVEPPAEYVMAFCGGSYTTNLPVEDLLDGKGIVVLVEGQVSRIPSLAYRSLAAILTRSARDSAFILCITRPRCAFTVISLMPSSPPTCLFKRPETTSAITCRSRPVRDA